MNRVELTQLVDFLREQESELQWLEFKIENYTPDKIGMYISALSNGARLHDREYSYLVWGIDDTKERSVIGVKTPLSMIKKGGEEIEHWLLKMLEPKIHIEIHEFIYQEKLICVLSIPAANVYPTKFKGVSYIRVGSYTKNIAEYPDKERVLWGRINDQQFENQTAKEVSTLDVVFRLIDVPGMFRLFQLPLPSDEYSIKEKLISEKIISDADGKFKISNLGAVLFAKNLNNFEQLKKKAIRVVVYDGNNRVGKIKRDITGGKGYALGFEGVITYVNDQLPANQVIKQAFRETDRVYPELAIRELIANAIIHQDFHEKGDCVRIEIFDDRIEITNPGKPIINTLRFIDEYKSRNEVLSDVMRRLRICEELGSGIDKVIASAEVFQLPAPEFLEMDKNMKVILFSPKKLKDMSRKDKVRACYQHCCLKYVSNEKMTNASLRERFKPRLSDL